MDFTKFVSLLQSRALFFARADLVGDPFEGSYSRANKAMRPTVYGKDHPIIEGKMSSFARWCRKWTFINCWHMNEGESAGMWRLYARTEEAIAISSRYNVLVEVLPSEVYVGQVTYIDFEQDWMPEGNTFYPFVHKQRYFEHEREVRAIMQKLPIEDDKIAVGKEPTERGHMIPVDLDKLIEGVYVAPTAPDWFAALVTDVAGKYGLVKPVTRSALDHEPFF
jgi:hypothetical protein